jgi:hypothetical protein
VNGAGVAAMVSAMVSAAMVVMSFPPAPLLRPRCPLD